MEGLRNRAQSLTFHNSFGESIVDQLPDDGDDITSNSQRSEIILEDDRSTGTNSSRISLTHIIWNPLASRTRFFATLVVLMGIVTSGILLVFGLSSSAQVQTGNFERIARDIVQEIDIAWHDYEVASLWIHQACHKETTNHFYHNYDEVRESFRDLYEYLLSVGLGFQFAGCSTNTTSERRIKLEKESWLYYGNHYPNITYRGIVGFEPDPKSCGRNNNFRGSGCNSSTTPARSEQPYYFPVHYVEPVLGNEEAIDFDLYSKASHKKALDLALQTWKPVLTQWVTFVKEAGPRVTSVSLLHPGIPLASKPDLQPQDLAILVIPIPSLMSYALGNRLDNVSVYLYDVTDTDTDTPMFLGASVRSNDVKKSDNDFVDLDALRNHASQIHESEMKIASSKWKVVVVASEHDKPDVTFLVLASTMIVVACICLALWLYTNMNRASKINQVKVEADREKAALLVDTSRKSAQMERDLNDFIAHEVRNPLAAALSACTFVAAAVNESPPLKDVESQRCVREDVSIIDSSLQFINDLLRNMLDMHRVTSQQMVIEFAPTDILNDVLQPVDSMLYRRDESYQLIIDCPDDLMVDTDKLRLKQIMLNLSRNASKFVQKGFIRIRAYVDEYDGNVVLSVEDSGPGIPKDKREKLFSKFQESLDTLRQGTGIGLCLCQKIAELMHASISLDETFHSGIEGCPGTRFVIHLNRKPFNEIEESSHICDDYEYQYIRKSNDSTTYSLSNSFTTDESLEIGNRKIDFDLSPSPLQRTFSPKFHNRSNSDKYIDNIEDKTQQGQHQQQQQQQRQEEDHAQIQMRMSIHEATENNQNTPTRQQQEELPKELSVLFVDDDLILRKLFARSVRKVVPEWSIQEAANGESALRLIDSGHNFDIIFIDQYMASVEKQLLGTETTRALRAKGIQSKICGLSANDVEQAFLKAGADSFLFKPLPCEKSMLTKALQGLIGGQQAKKMDNPARQM